jgi:acylphosphatase
MGLYRVHVIVEGRVQGVGYRMFTLDLAQQFKVSGFVKNRYDGRVEAEIEGEREIVYEVIEAMHARGSSIIRVDGITQTVISPTRDVGFEIR